MRRALRVHKHYAIICALTVAVSLVWTAFLVLQVGGASASQTISNLGLIVAAFAAAAGCFIAARRHDRYRRSWLILTGAMLSWGAGQVIWSYYEAVGREVPFPSLADVGYLGMPVLVAIALLSLPSASQSFAGRMRTVIDGMMIAGSILLISWSLVLGEVYEAGGDGLLAQVISLAYPLGDVVLITIALYVLLRGRDQRREIFPAKMIAIGIGAFALADSGFAYQTATGAYGSGSVVDIGWFVCFALIFLAGLRPQPSGPAGEQDENYSEVIGVLLPYAAVGLAIVTSSLEVVRTGGTDLIVSWCRTFILSAMVARQILTLSENRSLTRHLEDRLVDLRASEQRFESLVQHSSDVVTVIDVHGEVLYQSESIERVFGYSVDTVFGTSISTLLDEESAEALEQAVAEIMAEPYGVRVLELAVRHEAGHTCHAEMTVTNLLDNPSVSGIVLNTRDVSERKVLEDQLVYSAFHDSLTTLANRGLFRDRVDDSLKVDGTEGIAVLFLDLDGFKQVNDLLGHASGDLLLVQVAERLRECVRPGDTVARLGGDEFAVLLEATNDATAVEVAHRISHSLRAPFTVDGQEILVRGSLGLAIASSDVRDADKLLRNADLAMYRAKAAGEGSFERYDPEMHVDLVERLQLEADLRRAIEGKELVVHYQPIVEIATGIVSGVEALVRWKHPTRGLIAPTLFIPIAEDSGLIVKLGHWVLNEACRQTAAWLGKTASPELTVSVNISAGQLRPGFVEDVAAILAEQGLPAESLLLEMTESVLMDHTEENLAYFTQLKEMGVRIAIDDFGTGYSSLSYLHRFPIDVLKIDRAFVDTIGDSESDRALVTTIIQLGKSLQVRTVAEGIETELQMQALEEMGCVLGQGYYYSRPVTGRQIERLIGAGTDVRPGTSKPRPRTGTPARVSV